MRRGILVLTAMLVMVLSPMAFSSSTCESLFTGERFERPSLYRRTADRAARATRLAIAFGNLPAHVAIYKIFFKPPAPPDRSRHLLGILRDVDGPLPFERSSRWNPLHYARYSNVATAVPNRSIREGLHYLYRTRITPGMAIGDIADWTLRKVTFERSAFNGFSKLLLGIGLSMALLDPFAETTSQKLSQESLQESAIAKQDVLNELIASDFRFVSISERRDSGAINQTQALLQARALDVNLGHYYETLRARNQSMQPDSLNAQISDFGDSYFFRDTMQVVRNGIEKSSDPSIVQNHIGPIGEQRSMILFQLVHIKMSDLQFIDHVFARPDFEKVLAQQSIPYAHWKGLSNDYSQELMTRYQMKKLSKPELRYLLQQDVTNQYLFGFMSVVGVTQRDSEGQALSLERARQNILGYLN